jgi:hypothetical protein
MMTDQLTQAMPDVARHFANEQTAEQLALRAWAAMPPRRS